MNEGSGDRRLHVAQRRSKSSSATLSRLGGTWVMLALRVTALALPLETVGDPLLPDAGSSDRVSPGLGLLCAVGCP
jgi:hypothetical protein